MFKYTLVALLFFISTSSFAIDETPVEIIPLAPPLDQAQAELSGLTWCADKLLLLPQYPERFADDDKSYFYYLERQQITDYLDQVSTQALKAKTIEINERDLRKAVSIFDGFEAIACKGDKIWLSIEALNFVGTYQSFVVQGVISFDQQAKIEIDLQSLVFLSTQSNLKNMGDEAIVMLDNDVIALHEVNDQRAVSFPKARKVTQQNQPLTELQFPHIPFRITDATELDQDNRFWVINYKYSGDKFSRNAEDLLTKKYGEGASHKKYYNVERLIELKLEEQHIEIVDSAPIALKLIDVEGRNWEGLVRLKDRGFLLASDKHPTTLLGFVPYTKPNSKLNTMKERRVHD